MITRSLRSSSTSGNAARQASGAISHGDNDNEAGSDNMSDGGGGGNHFILEGMAAAEAAAVKREEEEAMMDESDPDGNGSGDTAQDQRQQPSNQLPLPVSELSSSDMDMDSSSNIQTNNANISDNYLAHDTGVFDKIINKNSKNNNNEGKTSFPSTSQDSERMKEVAETKDQPEAFLLSS